MPHSDGVNVYRSSGGSSVGSVGLVGTVGNVGFVGTVGNDGTVGAVGDFGSDMVAPPAGEHTRAAVECSVRTAPEDALSRTFNQCVEIGGTRSRHHRDSPRPHSMAFRYRCD